MLIRTQSPKTVWLRHSPHTPFQWLTANMNSKGQSFDRNKMPYAIAQHSERSRRQLISIREEALLSAEWRRRTIITVKQSARLTSSTHGLNEGRGGEMVCSSVKGRRQGGQMLEWLLIATPALGLAQCALGPDTLVSIHRPLTAAQTIERKLSWPSHIQYIITYILSTERRILVKINKMLIQQIVNGQI